MRNETTYRVFPLTLALVALTIMGPVAGQRQPTETSAEAPAQPGDGKPVTVTLWMHLHPPRVELDKRLIEQFMKDHPNITVEYEVLPSDTYDLRLRTALASGAGPDLFNQMVAEIGEYHASGLLAPLDAPAAGFADDASVVSAYDGGKQLLAGIVFDDRLHGLPTELSIYACFANDDLWRDSGLDPSTDFPTTWEQLREVAEQLTVRNGEVVIQRGFDFNWSNPSFMWLQFSALVRQLGGTLIDERTYRTRINTPEVARVMGYVRDWVNTWNLGGPQYATSRDAFMAGELATECSMGIWAIREIEQAGINWSVHKAPRWSDAVNESYLTVYAYFLMVNAHSEPAVQKAAWKLAGFLTQHPAEYFGESGLFQSRLEFVRTDAFLMHPVMPLFFEQMQTSFYPPRVPGWHETAAALVQARDRIVVDDEDIAAVLSDAEVQVQEILDAALRKSR